MKNRRPSWDEYFIGLVDQVAQRATCDRGRSGCIIVKDKRILCSGYYAAVTSVPHLVFHIVTKWGTR